MLPGFEQRLAPALQTAVAPAPVATGPQPNPAPTKDGLVAILAEKLELLPNPEAQPGSQRQAAYFPGQAQWTADGAQTDFTLPVGGFQQVAAVESPPGRRRTRGDDYFVEGGAVRFYLPPPNGQRVVALLQGPPAQGYLEQTPCRLRFSLLAWAQSARQAGQLLNLALEPLLAESALPSLLSAPFGAASHSQLRLLEPVIALGAIRQSGWLNNGQPVYQAQARFALTGQCQLLVALGQPEASGIISAIQYRQQGQPAGWVVSAAKFGPDPTLLAQLRLHPQHNLAPDEARLWNRDRLVALLAQPSGPRVEAIAQNGAVWQSLGRVGLVNVAGVDYLRLDGAPTPQDDLGPLAAL